MSEAARPVQTRADDLQALSCVVKRLCEEVRSLQAEVRDLRARISARQASAIPFGALAPAHQDGEERGRLLRLPDVIHAVGLSRATIYRMIQAGDFPAGVKLGAATGWREADVLQWIATRPPCQ